MSPFILHSIESYDLRSISPLHETFQQERIHLNSRAPEIITIILTCMSCINSLLDRVMNMRYMNNCSPWIHEIYQGIFEICTDLGILVVNAKYAQKYTVAYTRFFAQCVCCVVYVFLCVHRVSVCVFACNVCAYVCACMCLCVHVMCACVCGCVSVCLCVYGVSVCVCV